MKEHKTLLQYKREIEEDLKEIKKRTCVIYSKSDFTLEEAEGYYEWKREHSWDCATERELNKQLQMINDIIDQKEQYMSKLFQYFVEEAERIKVKKEISKSRFGDDNKTYHLLTGKMLMLLQIGEMLMIDSDEYKKVKL